MSLELPILTVEALCAEARSFAEVESSYPEPSLFGVTDGKAVGTYLEHKFKAHLRSKYTCAPGSSASGIDCPDLAVDIKVTSIAQPQSSCPFKSARQKIFGLGYSLLVFVYQKTDDARTSTSILDIKHVVFVDKTRTADFQLTKGLREILDHDGNADDLVAFMSDRLLPADEIELRKIADDLLRGKPFKIGYLTVSNALQWRLQYARVIQQAGKIEGLARLR
ncbi:MAG: restriction endonuclease [Armatimonadetes bacterium]|nr:restriction endonuclease [Armatimonadota bacterium]